MTDLGITRFGHPDAVYNMDRGAQVRLLAWNRVTGGDIASLSKVAPAPLPPVVKRPAEPESAPGKSTQSGWDFFFGPNR